MNWKSLVEKDSAKRFVLPPGWDSQEKVAEDLGCSADRVRLHLAPAIKDGSVKRGVFPVWDPVEKRVVRTTAFIQVPKATVKAPPTRS